MAFGNKVESVSKLKKQLAQEQQARDTVWIKYIPDGETTVRFLEEPDQWVRFTEAYDESARKSYPVGDDFTPPDEHRLSVRYLANALLVGEDRVVPLQVPKSLMDKVIKKYDRYGTIVDRDYFITREGKGLKTEYDLEADQPEKVNLKKYEEHLHDLEEVLEGAWRSYCNETGMDYATLDDEPAELDEPEDEEIKPRSRRKSEPEEEPEEKEPAAKRTRRKTAEEPVEDDNESDEKDTPVLTREELMKKPSGELRPMVRDKGINPRGMDKAAMVSAILGLPVADDDDEEPF